MTIDQEPHENTLPKNTGVAQPYTRESPGRLFAAAQADNGEALGSSAACRDRQGPWLPPLGSRCWPTHAVWLFMCVGS